MTPNQAYAQWKGIGADPYESESQTIRRFAQQFRLNPEDEDELLRTYPDQPKIARSWDNAGPKQKESGFLSQTFGAGVDELQKSVGSALAGPGAETLSDLGWEGGAGFLEDMGTGIVDQQKEDLKAYEAPQTRDELIEEGGVLGSLYENVFSPVLQTPQQLGRQALPSLGAAGIALGAAGVAALASGGNPFIVGATAMAVGNAVGSFQVGGEEFESAKRDPFIRKQLGIDPDAKFADLAPDQQRSLTDSAQRVAKDTMVERLYTSGALESLAFIPYGSLALRYIADIALGATSEEMDKRLGMEKTIQELERLGVTRAEVPELREKMKGLRPGTWETVLNAAVMEATFGAPTAIIETIAQPDSRVDSRLTADAEKKRILQQRLKEAQADPIKQQKAENDLIKQDDDREIRRQKEADRLFDRQDRKVKEAKEQEKIRVVQEREQAQQDLDKATNQDRFGSPIVNTSENPFADVVESKTAAQDNTNIDTETAKFGEELYQLQNDYKRDELGREIKKLKDDYTSISKSSRVDAGVDGEAILNQMDNVSPGTVLDTTNPGSGGNLISLDRIMHQVALNEFMEAFPQIDFRGSKLVKNKEGVASLLYEDDNKNLQSISDWELLEGFVNDSQIFAENSNPVVYLTQSMYDDGGNLITNTKDALDRMVEVAFHEAIGHAGLRNMLNAGTMISDPNSPDYQRWTGEQYNKFIDGFRNRHGKMLNKWIKGDGETYSSENEFRQTEEFIARNFGEAGGGRSLGFFDNTAILIREANPFIGNSLTQYQVAKQLQLVVDRYASGIDGKAPKKKNILSGVELVGTIARAATQAGIEKEIISETEIGLNRKEKAKAEMLQLYGTTREGWNRGRKIPETKAQEIERIKQAEKDKKKKESEDKAKIQEDKKRFGPPAIAEAKRLKTEKKVAETAADKKAKKEAAAQTKIDLGLALNKKTSAEVLDGLAKTGTPLVRMQISKNKNTSDETLSVLAADKQTGVFSTAMTQIQFRKDAKEKAAKKEKKAAEKIIADEKKATEKTAKQEANLKTAEEKVVTLKAKEKPTKTEVESLVRNKNKVKELKKLLSISASKRAKSDSEQKGKEGVSYAAIQSDDEDTAGEGDSGKNSLSTIYFAGRSISDDKVKVDALLNKKNYLKDIPASMQEAELLKLSRGKEETNEQFTKRFVAEVTKIRGKRTEDLKAAKKKLDDLYKTARGSWTKEQEKSFLDLREEISNLTIGKKMTIKERGKRGTLAAEPWEFFGMGVNLSQTDKSMSQLKKLPKSGKSQYSVSPEGVTDFDIIEAGIAIESLKVDLSNMMLSLEGDAKLTDKGRRLYNQSIKVSEKTINGLMNKRVDSQRKITKSIENALKILSPEESTALKYYMGMSPELGAMDQTDIAKTMAKEGFTITTERSKGIAPYQEWVGRTLNSAVEKLSGRKFKNEEELETNFEGVRSWVEEVMSKYPKATGEISLTGKALKKKIVKDDAETKRRWDELLTGRLGLGKKGDVPKELRSERTEAATALYRDTGLITKPSSKENWKVWGNISDEDMAYLKEAAGNPRSKDYEWPMKRPPTGLEVFSKDDLISPEAAEFQEIMDKEQENRINVLADDKNLTSEKLEKAGFNMVELELLAGKYLKNKKFSASSRSKARTEITAYKKVLASVQDKVIKAFKMASPQMQALEKYFTSDELELMSSETVTAMQNLLEAMPTSGTFAGDPRILAGGTRLNSDQLATMASLGIIKKGWYENSAKALKAVFEKDTGQFIALLAATSPQISVEGNLENTLNIWDEWIKAGRPTTKEKILTVMGKGVQKTPIEKRLTEQLEKITKTLGLRKGSKDQMIKRIKKFQSLSEENAELLRNASVMEAWLNNSVRALTGKPGAEIKLSGPKVESFRQNLMGNFDEVTQDTWEATALGVIQAIMGGQTRKLPVGGIDVKLGYKSPSYLVSSALHRQAAELLTNSTTNTETWTPAEVQETVWSFVKAVVEQRKSRGETRDISQIVADKTNLDKNIASVPDFATLLSTGKYSKILEGAGYANQIKKLTGLSKVGLKGNITNQGTYGKGDVGAISSQLEEFASTKGEKQPWDKSSISLARLRELYGVNDEAAYAAVTKDISDRFGASGLNTNPKAIQLYDLSPLINTDVLDNYLEKKGFNYKFFSFVEDKAKGIEFALPNLIGDGYHKKTLWIYNPEIEAASFRDSDYTKAWRVSHEIGHAVTEKFVQKKYGDSARDGRLGAEMSNLRGKPPKQVSVLMEPLTLKQAQRAIEWEDTAFRAQRQVLEDMGVKISDEQFIKEYNLNIKGAVHRIITGRFDEVIDEGFLPYTNKQANLKNILKMLENTEKEIARVQERSATKGVNLKTWKQVTDETLGKAVKKGAVSLRVPTTKKRKVTKRVTFSFSKRSKAIAEPASREIGPSVIKTIIDPNFRTRAVSKSKRSRPEISRSVFSAGADQRFGSRWTKFWLKQLSKVRPLSQLKEGSKEYYIQLRQLAFGQLAQWEYFSNSVFKALKDSKQSKEIYNYLTTPNANSSIIKDNNERVHAEKAKKAIEKIGETLVSKKLMKETTLRDFKKKHGDYLPRVYLRHLLNEGDRTAIARGLKPSNLDYLKKRRDIPKGIRELILGELTTQPGAPALLASRAIMVPGKDLAIMNWIQKMKDLSIEKGLEWVVPNQFVEFNTLEQARDIAKELRLPSSVIKELELDVDFSDMSTEVTPAWLTSESDKLRAMAVDLQGDNKKIVTALYRRMEDTAKAKEPMFREGVKIDGYRKLPNSARYGAMRGMWLHKQIADDIIGGMKLATGDESNWEKIVGDKGMMGKYNSYWKWAKVAGNPPSWARNYISNNILLTLAGIPFWSIPGLNLAALKEMRTKGKYYQVALRQGVMAGNMTNAELGKMETDFLEIERKMSDGGNPLAFLGGLKTATSGIKAATGKIMDATSSVYGGLETLGKIGAIKYAMEKKGMNESDAAAFANKWLFDYGLVTPSVRYASTAVVGAPFIRFQSHAIPLMLEVGLTKPWRFLPYYALGYGMIEMFKNSHDIDEEEYESILMALAPWLQEKALNPKIPGTSIPLLPPNILPIPFLDKQGRWQIHDVSYLMPFGMISEVAGEVAKGRFSDALKSLGMMGGPLADMMVVIKTGIDPFTRRPITDEMKPYNEQVADYLKYIYNMSMPSMFHTSHGAVNRIWDSSVGNLDPKTGEMKYEPMQAWLRLAGQNIYPTNLVEQRETNLRRMKWEMGNLKSAYTRRLRGLMKSKASKEEITEAREDFREQLEESKQEMRDYSKNSKIPQSLRSR